MDWCPPGHQPIPAYVSGIQVLANQAKSADTQQETYYESQGGLIESFVIGNSS